MSQQSSVFVRLLQNTYNSTGGGLQDEKDGGNQETYEFVAFLLWYLFLVVCCVLPTCCAYRRRRLMEARIAQQQANFDHLQQQNVFILSSLQLRPDMDGEEARTERTKRITEALKVTTFMVRSDDIVVKEEGSGEKNTSSIHVDEELGAVLDHETMDRSSLTLPSDSPNGSRSVPGGCAICLCPYEAGDQVTWSGEEYCNHAFHTECIIPWLAKKSEPKCPCCRQDYCVVEPVTAADLNAMTPFGLIPSSLFGHPASPFYNEQSLRIPTPDLAASHIVPETAMVTMPTNHTAGLTVHSNNEEESANSHSADTQVPETTDDVVEEDNNVQATATSGVTENTSPDAEEQNPEEERSTNGN